MDAYLQSAAAATSTAAAAEEALPEAVATSTAAATEEASPAAAVIEEASPPAAATSTAATEEASFIHLPAAATSTAAATEEAPRAEGDEQAPEEAVGGDGGEEDPIILGAADAGEDHEGEGPPRRDATEDEEVKDEMMPQHDDADEQQSFAVVDGNNNDVDVVELDEDASLEEASEAPGSPNARFVKLVRDQLSLEVSAQWPSLRNKWLLEELKTHDWWIRRERVKYVLKKLAHSILPAEVEFTKVELKCIRGTHVWIPEQRWGADCMPACNNCLQSDEVRTWGFQHKHCARRVLTEEDFYNCMTRRYSCSRCSAERAQVAAAAQAERLQIVQNGDDDDDDDGGGGGEAARLVHTFMGYDAISLTYMARGRGDHFPAFLTHKAGVDKKIVDTMRPNSVAGVRSGTYAKMLLEFHTKNHIRAALQHEHETESNILRWKPVLLLLSFKVLLFHRKSSNPENSSRERERERERVRKPCSSRERERELENPAHLERERERERER
jgi:hypothetical protein